jgi:hypothetical protein
MNLQWWNKTRIHKNISGRKCKMKFLTWSYSVFITEIREFKSHQYV